MPNISLNGERFAFCGDTLADLIQQQQPAMPFAAAVNTVFIPKTQYAQTRLQENDSVDIVRPVVGG